MSATPHTPEPRRPRRIRFAGALPSAAVVMVAALLQSGLLSDPAAAFCGFYVGKADAGLFNHASQVVLVRDGDRTVITMASDYRGDPREFALVVPVPTVLERGQIHVAEQALLDHLDAYSAPRLVEYFDADPCAERDRLSDLRALGAVAKSEATRSFDDGKELGVRIEAKYAIGEYQILILSADESRGLETWLRRSGYRIPHGASAVLESYLKQGMRFFVAKVDLEEQARLGVANLRPLQIAFEHPRFMLPLRLGTVNADGDQELFVYAITRHGRVETTNYRTVRLTSDVELPEFVENDFPGFYRALFERQHRREGGRVTVLEYAWDMSSCDPCATEPLSIDELQRLGVFWTGDGSGGTFLTRLHVRYNQSSFPEDLVFHETADRGSFQGRYVLRRPWRGGVASAAGTPAACPAARAYRAQLGARLEQQARTLSSLTGWDLAEIRARLELPWAEPAAEPRAWWERLWPGR